MEEILKNLLKPLRRITPDSGYMANSKALISMRSQELPVSPSQGGPAQPLRARFVSRIFESITLTAGLALASVLMVVALGSLSFLAGGTPSGTVASSFNKDSLAIEAKSIDFSMQIKEIGYFDESAKQVALALDKISEKSSNETTPEQP